MTKLLIPRPASLETRQNLPLRSARKGLRGMVTTANDIRAQVQQAVAPSPPTRQQIEKRAYYLYLERGGVPGDSNADWNIAEQQAWAEYRIALAAFEKASGTNIPS